MGSVKCKDSSGQGQTRAGVVYSDGKSDPPGLVAGERRGSGRERAGREVASGE
jgi:hypothetical protein